MANTFLLSILCNLGAKYTYITAASPIKKEEKIEKQTSVWCYMLQCYYSRTLPNSLIQAK